MAQPRYQVIERIDAGGMAEVFKAESTSMQGFQKLVAIKRVLPSLTQNERFVRMFLDEAKVSLHLNHTNCVQVFDLGIADGTYFIVMEFVNGTNLKNILEELARRNHVLPLEQVVYIAIEICKGLAHAHDKKDLDGRPLHIVHRDISPPNVLMSREGEVKITDFGLAKAQSQVETTDPGVVKGKFGYLSPEAANGEEVDPRTDIFAVGILLWEMLIGRRLFLGKTDYETLKQVQVAKIPPMSQYRSDIPHQLEEIVARALAKDINRRYQDCRSLANALADFLYSYGRPVTSFDLSRLVNDVMDARGGVSSPVDSKVNEAVQREINKLVSLEEVEDLDLYLATNYESASSHEDIPINHSGSFEDPASWAGDLDIGADEAPSFLARMPTGEGGADTWQEGGLGDLLTAENAQAAVEKAREEARQRSEESELAAAPSQRQPTQHQQAHARQAHQPAQPQQLAQQHPGQQHQQAPQHQQAHAPQPHAQAPPIQGDSSSNKIILLAVAVVVLVILFAIGLFVAVGG